MGDNMTSVRKSAKLVKFRVIMAVLYARDTFNQSRPEAINGRTQDLAYH